MKGLRFGTDGVRGRAHVDLTAPMVRLLGRVAADVLGPEVVLGRDTRLSGPVLADAFAAGVRDGGGRCIRLGVAPTPAVATLCALDQRPGAVISASHNPWTDNGVKLFASGGRKLDDDVQTTIQDRLDRLEAPGTTAAGAPDEYGGDDELARYRRTVVTSAGGRQFDDLHVVIDCGNGASVRTAPAVLHELGARLHVINDQPDGRNINDGCGSNHPEMLAQVVLDRGADVGFAFDGDADRVIAVDHLGRIVDGDQLIAVLAVDRQARGRLPDDTVVVTVMTNLGFRLGMAERHITVVDTPVGDRYVSEALEQGGWALGGEQSGHVIFADLATTGDGLLTAVQVLDVLHRRGRPLANLADDVMTRLPQVLENVPVRAPVDDLSFLDGAVAAAESELGATGRVLVRPSGTEPLVRVMVEAEAESEARRVASRLVEAVRNGHE